MPVPEEKKLYDDWEQCEICGNDYPVGESAHVIVDDENPDPRYRNYRYVGICKACRWKCKTDREFEKSVVKRVFESKLGRPVTLTGKVK